MQSYTQQNQNRAKNKINKDALKKIGFVLRGAREKKSLSINDLHNLTHIPYEEIISIESGNRDKLPEDIYLIGLISDISRNVGIDEELLLRTYIKVDNAPVKKEKKDSVNESFDMLFNSGSDDYSSDELFNLAVSRDKGFQVYHFYFLFGIALFLIASFMMFKTNSDTSLTPVITVETKSILKSDDIDIESAFGFDEDETISEIDDILSEDTELTVSDLIEPAEKPKAEEQPKAKSQQPTAKKEKPKAKVEKPVVKAQKPKAEQKKPAVKAEKEKVVLKPKAVEKPKAVSQPKAKSQQLKAKSILRPLRTSGYNLSLRVKGKSWIRVLSARNNEVIFQGLVTPSTHKEILSFSDPVGFFVRLGNKDAVQVNYGKGFVTLINSSIVANWAYPQTLLNKIPVSLLEGKKEN